MQSTNFTIKDYTFVTELPGNKVSQEQLQRMWHRYHFASGYCKKGDVLEVACGAGTGLGYLAKYSNRVVGVDIDISNLKFGMQHYAGRNNIELKQMDAHRLLFSDKAFDLLILYEAIYYLADPDKFIEEAHRTAKDNGTLIICAVNKNWADFNPSEHSIAYYSVPELYAMLIKKFNKVKIYGAFSTKPHSLQEKMISLIKRTAVSMHLIPKTMKAKAFLKRIFFGKLIDLPCEITDFDCQYVEPARLNTDSINSEYKVIYAVASK